MTEDQLFLAALDQPNASARNAYLDEACGDDAVLRRKVESLLAAHFQSGEFLDTPAPEQVRIDTSPSCAVTIESGNMSHHDHEEEADDSETLKFLAPSSRPESLGRIGHYEVLQVLGKGGFGIVLRAFDDVLQRIVAIKVMAPQLAATSPARKRFLREARSSAQVRHENVVQVYEVGEQPLPYLVMEFIPGETLQQRIDRVGPLEVKEVLQIGRQIAEGLAAAHAQDLIHRDIKPGNVLLEGAQHKVKITDFGLARAADDASMTQSGQIAGTPMYMAPEQALGQTLDQRADLFSLGSVLYQMVAGRPPFRANTAVAVLKRVVDDTPRNIREVIPETPQWLCDIIAKLHAKKPDDRYQSAREVADLLADCEAQLAQNSRLQDFSRIPGERSEAAGKRKWAAPLALLGLLPIFALLISELTGTTRLFRGQDTAQDPVGPTITTPVADAKPKPDADGFVQLFNGQDLTGWQAPESNRESWSVESGVLVGRGPEISHILSERGDFQDFHLRAEVRFTTSSDSGIVFRCQPDPSFVTPIGYETHIAPNDTGMLLDTHPARGGQLATIDTDRLDPNSYARLEVIVRGNHIRVLIDERIVLDHADNENRYAQGHIALQVGGEGTAVRFRKIEIKELPPEEPGFVQLFNGRDLTGWKTHPEQPGNWDVTNGILVGHTSRSHLFTERDDFANFHLRAEVKLNQGGDSGIRFRAPFALARGKEAWQVQPGGGYEAEFNRFPGSSTHTGSVQRANPPLPPTKLFRAEPGLLVLPDEWATYEVIADGNRIVTKLNGREVASCVDPDSMYSRGHIALQCFSAQTVVQYRKIEIKELPASPPAADGFVALFNGKDLTGWKKDRDAPGHWEVKDGVLIGSRVRGFLYSERADFANFHLRVQAKVNLGGDSGVFFRLGSEVPPAGGYEAEIHKNRAYGRKTGTIEAFQPGGPPLILGLVDDDSLTQPDEWFDLEIITQGGRFITKINGQEAANCNDPANARAAGHIGLQVWNPNTVVQFRKIEIKELPASPPADGFVSLFNGQDLTGWKTHLLSGGEWKVENGAIYGRGTTSYLFSESGDYDNFHLRVEAKINGNGDAGVCFRTPYDVKGLRQGGPAKFGLLEGYEAAIAARPNYANNSGSLTAADGTTLQAGPPLPHQPDEWFVLEVIAEDNHIRTLVDGKPMVDYVDEERRASRGHIALQVWGPNITSVQFRKIEIKELPASPSSEVTTPTAVAPFTAADVQRIAGLPAEQQVAAVVASLKERNPSLNGTASHKIVDGAVTEFNFNPTDDQNALTDVSPVRALAGLTSLNLWNCSAVADLGPLQGLPLTRLLIGSLDASNQVRDLKPLQGMKLTELQLYQCQVEDLQPLAGMPLIRLRLFSRQIRDCEPLKGMPLTTLDLSYCTQIQDFTPLTGLPLTGLHLNGCQIRDLQPLLGLKLTEVSLAGTRVRDLQQLRSMPLKNLAIHRTGVTDLTPLQGMKLEEIFLSPQTITQGLNHLRDMQSLHTIGIGYASSEKWPAAEFWERYDKGEFAVAPFTDADAKRIAALPAAQQVEQVRQELMRRNPRFDGKVTSTIENGAVTEFAVNTDEILDITPVRALTKLVSLDLRGTYPNKGKLTDISPLRGMAISRLDCSSTQISDLSPLAGLPLTFLHFNHNPVSDLAPLKGMPLEELGLAETKVADLSPLKGMKIKVLGAQLLPVTDLSPLAGMPLTGLDLYHTIGVTSLEPLRGMPLEGLNLQDVPVSDLSPLAGMTTLRTLLLQGTKVSDLSPLAGLKLTDLLMQDKQITDLSPLAGMPLARLHIQGTGVSDLRPLAGMPLVEFRLNPKNITEGMDVVRGLKTIQTIGTPGNPTWKPEEFWERYDQGEFKP